MNRIREVRESKGIKQGWVAQKIGVGKSTMCLYENSLRPPSRPALQRIASALGVQVKDIWDEPDQEVETA